MAALTVGFDLDMTLADPRAGIVATYAALAAELGVPIDGELAASRLGPPLEVELAHWVPEAAIPGAAARFRALYPELAVPATVTLAGAPEAIEAVRRHGGRVVVVTAKLEGAARLTLAHLGLEVDAVVGWRWGAGKADALREHGASVYVGDHASDAAAARAAGATAVAVLTGPCPRHELTDADIVLDDLTAFPAWLDEHEFDLRLATLDARLRELGSVLVAFSGGADSAFLLAAAVRALGPANVAAATAVSPSLAEGELAAAAAFAGGLGVRHFTPRTDELSRAGYRANGGDRCYFCKAELLDVVTPLAADVGLAAVATGTNADDAQAGFRPGIRAAAERGAVTPLLDAGLRKDQVRAASRRWGLRTADKPAAACLSSRIAYGVQVTPARLARVDRAERALRTVLERAGLAVTNLRVRDLGDLARVEVDLPLVPVLVRRPELLESVEGFAAVEVDPRGFRSGSMNELITAHGDGFHRDSSG